MKTKLALLAAVAAATIASAARAGPSVEIEDAVARVSVIPEARQDVKVEFIRTHPGLPMTVRHERGRTVVDGNLERRIGGCRMIDNRAGVRVRDVGWVDHDEMPQILIRVPRDAEVAVSGAVFGAIDRSASLKLSNAGCGDWVVADVAGPMHLNLAGSGGIRTGKAGRAKVRLAGAADIHTQAIQDGLEVSVAGSGDVVSASVSGPLNISVAGRGDVKVGGGRVTEMTVNVAGSGDAELRGTADSLKVRIAGSGDVRVDRVQGEVSKAIIGSGDVIVGGRS
ncbi:MAG: DUF2807 domain-containing protein [Caulobacteraceae bacterium]|nr:DUF2807 domain-containing protein [Caulobacteraceae bacterium]